MPAPNTDSELPAFFEIAPVGAAQIDAATRKFLRSNRRFSDMVGYSKKELRQLTFFDLTPEDREHGSDIFSPSAGKEASDFTIEKRLRRKDGSSFWALLSIGLTRNAEGEVVRGLAIIQDISAQKENETLTRQRDREILRSEQQLAAIFAGAAAGLSEISLDGQFERVNDELCRILGYSREILAKMSVLEVTHPDDVVDTLRALGEMLETGKRVSIEKRYLRADGEIIWASSMLTRLDDAAGRPRSVLAVTIDLTARHQAERALELSESKFRILAEASPALIWFADPDGKTRYANRRYLQFFGETDSVANSGWRPHVHPEDKREYSAQFSRAILERCPLFCRARFQRADGEWRWLESQALPHFGEDVQYLGLVGHSLDVTELVETSHALAKSEDRLRRAMEIDTVGIAFFTASGRITEANAAFLQLTDYTMEEVANGNLRLDLLTAPEYRKQVSQALAEVMALGRTASFEKQLLTKEGIPKWGLVAATRLAENEGVEFIVDVTARRRTEEALSSYRDELEERVVHRTAELDAANGLLRNEIIERTRGEKLRQELLRQLATVQEEERRRISRELHDQVGQDLTALMLGLKSLDRRPPDPDSLQRLEVLAQSIGKQIHDLALEIRPTALDDLGLSRTLAYYVEEWSQRSGVRVDFHSSGWEVDRLPATVETMLYRIVLEALNNVLKHAQAKHVSLIIERQQQMAVVIVEDDGCGFDPNRQTKSGAKRLGLVGMRERASLAGGELSIESAPGSGTTVFVRVPLPPRESSSHA